MHGTIMLLLYATIVLGAADHPAAAVGTPDVAFPVSTTGNIEQLIGTHGYVTLAPHVSASTRQASQ